MDLYLCRHLIFVCFNAQLAHMHIFPRSSATNHALLLTTLIHRHGHVSPNVQLVNFFIQIIQLEPA